MQIASAGWLGQPALAKEFCDAQVEKDDKNSSGEDYLEFQWADYLRGHCRRLAATKDIDSNFDDATNGALRLAAQKDAMNLPGYTGKIS